MADRSDEQRVPRVVARRLAQASASLSGERDLVGRSTRRRAGVFRRALRAEVSRLRDPHRLVAIAIFVVVGGVLSAGLVARGEAAGADAHAYWAAVRIWLNGGDPYHPTGPFLPYVYPPWMLPLFAPWALLPWDVAWFVWRGTMVLLLAWSIHWAYSRRHLETALVFLALSFPIAANLDTGNITLLLAFMCWAAQFVGPPAAGGLWAVATWMKWVPAPLLLVLAPRGRLWGLAWLALCILLSLLTLPLTLVQFDTLFGFGPRPIRLDYLVLLWAVVPWWWRHPRPLWWLRPSAWPGLAGRGRTTASAWVLDVRSDPPGAVRRLASATGSAARRFLGLPPIASTGPRTPA